MSANALATAEIVTEAVSMFSPAVGGFSSLVALEGWLSWVDPTQVAFFFTLAALSFFKLGCSIWDLVVSKKENQPLFKPTLQVTTDTLSAAVATVGAILFFTTQLNVLSWAIPSLIALKAVSLLILLVKAWVAYFREHRHVNEANKPFLLFILAPKTLLALGLMGMLVGSLLFDVSPTVLLIAAIVTSCVMVANFMTYRHYKKLPKERRVMSVFFRELPPGVTPKNQP